MALLEVTDLRVSFHTRTGVYRAVNGVSFQLDKGEILGVVGESGSGKSVSCQSLLGLIPQPPGRIEGGRALFDGVDLLRCAPAQLRAIRGKRIAMIFQDPMTSLNPYLRISEQLMEPLFIHEKLGKAEAFVRALAMLESVGITDAAKRIHSYPHEFSGGMRQRVMIAMALITRPDILIADEPTTALDVTVQAQILEIMRDLKKELKTAIVLISHDMGVIAGMADKVQVMRLGEVVESGRTEDVFYAPQHDYTKALLDAMPRIDRPMREGHAMLRPPSTIGAEKQLLDVEDLKVYFPIKTGGFLIPKIKPLRAVDGVSFSLRQGETLGIVGESGCGKSTLARAIMKLIEKTDGAVVWAGRDLADLHGPEVRKLRKEFQIVFQDPLASLDPRMTIGESIAEPLATLHPELSRAQVQDEVRAMMRRVGLEPGWINRYPHELSGGQNQRVGIARAMIVKPKLIVCDEAVSALDVSIQSQIVDLILNLQSEFGMSMIFISHDLSVVRQVAHRVMVLYLGRVVELADRNSIYEDPRHPYTRALIAAVPVPDPKAERGKSHVTLAGDLPSPLDSRAQLSFLKSKMIDNPDAEQYRPRLIEVATGHYVAEHDAA